MQINLKRNKNYFRINVHINKSALVHRSFLQKSGPNPNGDGHTEHKLIKMQYTDSSTRYVRYCGKADCGILEKVQ